MIKNILPLIFVIGFQTTVFGQMPTMSDENERNISNNKVLTNNDMVFHQSLKPVKKVPLDTNSILIYDYNGTLISYNFNTDKINWNIKATDPDREMCGNKLTLNDGIIYVPFINGEIYALNNQTGKPFWKTRLGNIKDEIIIKNQIPVIVDNNLYIATENSNSNIYAIDIKDGSLVWNYKLPYPYNNIPVLFFENKTFVSSAPYFNSFDAKTGKALYQRGFEVAMYGKPITDGNNVFIANEKDVLFALKPDNLDILWEFKLMENQSYIKEKIFCKDKKIFFGANASIISSVYSINSETGKLIWKSDFSEEYIEYIIEQGNSLWGYTGKGLLFKLDLITGKNIFEKKLINKPISNIEFIDENSLFYYCEAGLIKFDIQHKTEELIYMRNSIDTDADNAYLKIIR